jgi:hypothetical protein
MVNLAHRDSREHPTPMEPGTSYRVRFELEVTSWIFEVGHRIRLDLAGGDWPNAWAPPGPATLGIERAGSTLTLPVLDGPAPVEERPEMPPPRERSAAIPSRGSHDYRWQIEHDVAAGETRAVVGNWGDYPAEGDVPSFAENYRGVVSVSSVDPGTAKAEGETRFEMRFPEVTATSHVQTSIESTREEYRVRIELRVSEDGAERWVRRWDRTFPRDLQ